MKKSFWSGIGVGVVLTTLIAGISVTALAAGRNITVEDGVRVTVNGTELTPRDANGREVPVFSYNGTVYVPVRTLSNALGFAISYNAENRVAAVTAATPVAVPDSPAYLGQAKAKETALTHAGVSAADANFVKVQLDSEDGQVVYEVEFYTKSMEYDYEIDAKTGTVVSYDHDAESYAPPVPQGNYIGEARAKEIARGKAPSATVIKCELDIDDGRPKYELELRDGAIEYDCEVDAVTGAILKWERD